MDEKTSVDQQYILIVNVTRLDFGVKTGYGVATIFQGRI